MDRCAEGARFDADRLTEIHRLYQEKQCHQAAFQERWDAADAAWRAELAEVERQVRAEIGALSKAQLRQRFEQRAGWAPDAKDRHWTRERFLDDEIRRAQDKVPNAYARCGIKS